MTSARRLALDYVAPPCPAWPGWLMCCLGVLLVIGAIGAGIEARRQSEALAAALRIQARADRKPQPPDPALERRAAAEIKAARDALRQLNFPWQRTFDAVERTTPREVALLALRPDMARWTVTVTAETGDPDAMLSYWKSLAAAPELRGAHIVHYEIGEQRGRAAVRFQIQADLGDRP